MLVLCFEQKDSQGFENSYNSYEQYPLEKFFIFTIYQNYTLALTWFCFLFPMIFLLQTRLPVYLSHDPAGTSVMDVVHYAQVSLEVECHLVYTHVWDMFCCKKQYLTFCQFEAFASEAANFFFFFFFFYKTNHSIGIILYYKMLASFCLVLYVWIGYFPKTNPNP